MESNAFSDLNVFGLNIFCEVDNLKRGTKGNSRRVKAYDDGTPFDMPGHHLTLCPPRESKAGKTTRYGKWQRFIQQPFHYKIASRFTKLHLFFNDTEFSLWLSTLMSSMWMSSSLSSSMWMSSSLMSSSLMVPRNVRRSRFN